MKTLSSGKRRSVSNMKPCSSASCLILILSVLSYLEASNSGYSKDLTDFEEFQGINSVKQFDLDHDTVGDETKKAGLSEFMDQVKSLKAAELLELMKLVESSKKGKLDLADLVEKGKKVESTKPAKLEIELKSTKPTKQKEEHKETKEDDLFELIKQAKLAESNLKRQLEKMIDIGRIEEAEASLVAEDAGQKEPIMVKFGADEPIAVEDAVVIEDTAVTKEPEVVEKCFKAVNRGNSQFAAPIEMVNRQSNYNPAANAAMTPKSVNRVIYSAAPRQSVKEVIEARRDKGVNFDIFQFQNNEEEVGNNRQDLKKANYNDHNGSDEGFKIDYDGYGDYSHGRKSGRELKSNFSMGSLQRKQPQQQHQKQPQPQKQPHSHANLLKIQNATPIEQNQSKSGPASQRDLQKMQEARQSERFSRRSNKLAELTKRLSKSAQPDDINTLVQLNGVKLTFCQSAALGVIANFRFMGLKFPHEATSLEREKSAKFIIAVVNEFPCENEQEMIKSLMVFYPPIYSDRRSFNRWASQFQRLLIKEMNIPVSLDMNSVIVPVEENQK